MDRRERDREGRRQRYIQEYKDQAVASRWNKFKRMLRFGIGMVCILMIVGGATATIAEATSRPTGHGPSSTSEQFSKAESLVSQIDQNLPFQERRGLENEILRSVSGDLYSWPEYGIGDGTRGQALPEQLFNQAISDRGIPMAQILQTIRGSHSLYENGITVAAFTEAVINLVNNANDNIRNATRGEFPTVIESLRAPLQNHIVTSFMAALYVYLIWSLASGGIMTAEKVQEDKLARKRAEDRLAEDDRQEVLLLIETSRQEAAQQAARQFLITYVSLNTAQQQAVVSAGIENGSITPEFAENLQQELLKITNTPSGLHLLAAAAADRSPLGGGKKKKQSKRAKSQKGGATPEVILSYDTFIGFINRYVPEEKRREVENYLNIVLNIIDVELYVAYRFAQDDKNLDQLHFLSKYKEPGAYFPYDTPVAAPAAAYSFSSEGSFPEKAYYGQGSPSGPQYLNLSPPPSPDRYDGMDVQDDNDYGYGNNYMEMGGRSRQSRRQRQARRSRKGGKKARRQRQTRRERQTKRQRQSRRLMIARRA